MKAKFWYDERNWRTVETDPPDELVADFIRSCSVRMCHEILQIYEDIKSGKTSTGSVGSDYITVFFEKEEIYVVLDLVSTYMPPSVSKKYNVEDFITIIRDYMHFLQKVLEDFLSENYPEIAWDFEKEDFGQFGNSEAVFPLYHAFIYAPERERIYGLTIYVMGNLGEVTIPYLIEQTKKLSIEEPAQLRELVDIVLILSSVDDGTHQNQILFHNNQLIEFFQANRNHPDKRINNTINGWFRQKEIVEEEGLYT